LFAKNTKKKQNYSKDFQQIKKRLIKISTELNGYNFFFAEKEKKEGKIMFLANFQNKELCLFCYPKNLSIHCMQSEKKGMN
jgi:hypothetical protein